MDGAVPSVSGSFQIAAKAGQSLAMVLTISAEPKLNA